MERDRERETPCVCVCMAQADGRGRQLGGRAVGRWLAGPLLACYCCVISGQAAAICLVLVRVEWNQRRDVVIIVAHAQCRGKVKVARLFIQGLLPLPLEVGGLALHVDFVAADPHTRAAASRVCRLLHNNMSQRFWPPSLSLCLPCQQTETALALQRNRLKLTIALDSFE